MSVSTKKTPATVKRKKSSFPETPLTAELSALTAGLSILGPRPLKLVADSVCPQFNETAWSAPKWSLRKRGTKLISKDLLPFAADTFQFSLAGSESKQDYHCHDAVFEIYVSSCAMQIRYNGQKRLKVNSGALLVPPGIWHQVTLSGPAFVFQAVCGTGKIHSDKQTTPRAKPAVIQQ